MAEEPRESKKPKASWEKDLEEALKPVKPDWEEYLAEATGPQVDELERVSEELKEYGVEQKPAKANPIIPAVDWSRMSNSEILTSIEVAARVLKERRLEKEEKRLAGLVAKDLVDIAMDPPQVEEEEYEEVRRRARLAKGEKLLPV
jgi:hypothetical protein